jgi:cobyrinic acid a,c-diamide synthase
VKVKKMEIPRIVIAGTKSKVGKTMISIGLMRALAFKGYVVQPYKVGPDFIDPGFHHLAAGRYSRNLDSFMLSKEAILHTFVRNFRGADIAVIEGKTGLYDSSDAVGERGSVAEISKILKSPVILIVDAERINRSIAAIVLGYKLFDPEVDIRGVILNRVGNPRHATRVREAVEKLAQVEVLGVIPRSEIEMPYRHLGLVTAYERDDLSRLFDKLSKFVEQHVDVDRIVEIAESAPPIEYDFANEVDEIPIRPNSRIKIGVFRDRVFSFYYQDNLDILSQYADIVTVDSLSAKKLPEVDALYIGGGFPEVFAAELEKNRRLREEIHTFCDSGNPVYAECGGLMFLSRSIVVDGEEYEMVGFLPLKTEMKKRFQAQGYSVYRATRDCHIAGKGDLVVGHEFHYSKPELLGRVEFAFRVERGRGIDGRGDGIIRESTLANYIHVHFMSNPKIAKRFVEYIRNVRSKKIRK